MFVQFKKQRKTSLKFYNNIILGLTSGVRFNEQKKKKICKELKYHKTDLGQQRCNSNVHLKYAKGEIK